MSTHPDSDPDKDQAQQPADGPEADTSSTSQDEPEAGDAGSPNGAGDRVDDRDHDPESPGDSNERADARVEIQQPSEADD
jgi:hypothetical protein